MAVLSDEELKKKIDEAGGKVVNFINDKVADINLPTVETEVELTTNNTNRNLLILGGVVATGLFAWFIATR